MVSENQRVGDKYAFLKKIQLNSLKWFPSFYSNTAEANLVFT